MRILIYGSTYLTEICVKQLKKDGYNLVGYIPSENPTFRGKVPLPIVDETIEHDIKLSIQYDKKMITHKDAFNLHTGLLPEYGGCSILYHTIKIGLSNRKILNEVVAINGKLPCPEGEWDKTKAIREGEIPFTNIIHNMGYKMERMGKFDGWDIRNYCLPYYNVR